MSSIFTPTNQKRLTNVSVVRLKKAGKRFEVACYPNKVTPWRDRIETDLDEVLQTPHVYANVSKGEFAKRQDMEKAFGSTCSASNPNAGGIDELRVCELILRQGELQLTDRERAASLAQLTREVATLISSRCLNPLTNRPYPTSMVETAMRELRPAAVQLRQDRGAKQHMLLAIRRLNACAEESGGRSGLALLRAQMRVCVRAPASDAALAAAIVAFLNQLEQHVAGEWTGLCEPGALRELQRLVREGEPGGGQVEIVDLRVDPVEEGHPLEEGAVASALPAPLSEEESEHRLDGAVEAAEVKHLEAQLEKTSVCQSQKADSAAAAQLGAEDRKLERRRQRKEKRADQHSQLRQSATVDQAPSDKPVKVPPGGAARGKRKNKKGQRGRVDFSDED